MDVLEEKIRRVGVAPENRALTTVRAPLAAGAVFRPNDLVDHNKSEVAKQDPEIRGQRKGQ